MPKPQDIFQLARQEAVRVTASPQAWQSFLYTAAHNYHTTYLNQLLIHAQRPDAAACASMEYWNKQANRLVMRGSRSITVLQRRQGVAVTKPVFAIGDTTLLSQTRTSGPWEVTDTTRPLLLQGKSDDWLAALAQEGVSNDADRARRMLERNVADSTLQWAQPDEQMQLLQVLVTQSAVYMARLRIGLPVQDEDYPAFQSVSQFDTCQISLCLGGYLQAAAEPMLNAIGREALRLNRDSIAISHEPVHNESTRTQLNSREEAIHHDVHEEPRRLPDSEPFPAEPAEPLPEPLREAASGISGAERADALRPTDVGGHAADELQPNRTGSTADGGQDPTRADADHPDAGPQDEPAGLDADNQQPEKAGGGDNPSDAVRSLTEAPAKAESEQALSAFALPEFPPTLLPQLLAAETSSRADNAEYFTFFNKNPLLIDRLRFVRESYKDIFTELLLADDTRVGFHRQDNGLLVWQGAYLTRSAETLLSWRAVANALNDLIEQHELIAAIDPKELPQVEEQLSFELPDGSPTSAEDDRFEKDDFLTPEKQETVIRSALPVAEYNAPQMDDGSVITDEEVNLALAAGSNFENSKFRIYQQFTTTQGDHAAFLKKEYGSGGRSWDYQSGAHGWVDHGPAGLKLILTNEEGRFERRLLWRAAAKRIAYLIEMQRFLTPQELEQYSAWAAEQREPASAVRDEPSTVPENRSICAEGSVVYLEDDHRFTVERIGQFDVHLRDEEAPLFGRAISREEFQRQLDANPHNGGMMLSEQQHEALVQTQTEQALSYIEDYLKDEFEITEPDFSDLTQIDLGYTTTEDEKHVIQVYADLEHCTVTKLVDDTLYAQERYGSLDDLNQAVLSNLDFDSLMEIDLDEAEEHEPQGNALPTDESAAQAPTNYLAPYEPEIPTGAKAKFAANLNAIRTLKQIEQRGTPATEAEQDVLAGYLGWGGLADAFDPNKDSWHSEYEQLKDLLTPEEYDAAQESTLTAFYTPPAVIHAMYRALTRMGCVGGNVLEPSMGVGAFFGHRSGSFDTNNAKLYGVELDSVSGRIAQQLYQKAKIQICGYEKADLPDSFFDLAIGNVPFGQYQVTDRQYDKLHFQIHDYFLAKTVDKLRVGGIMAFITTSGTMDKKSEGVRRYLAARCDLIGAVRLPNNINKEYDNEHPKWDFSGETQAIAKTYEVNADEIAAYNRTLTAAGDNKNGKGDGWQPTGRANEYQLAEIFSNDSGNIRVQGLSYGTYLVVETTTPHDLFQAEPFLVSIDPEQDNNPWGAMATPKDSVMKASDSYQKFTVLDEEIEVYLKITKLDTETGKPVLLPNTAFQIYWLDDNGNYRLENGKPKLVTMTDTVNGHLTKNVDTFYTNEEGILTLPEKLPLGKYRIVETVGPNGFYNEWADSGNYYVDFDISTDRIYKATGDDNENGMDTLVIGEDYWNEETLGKLTIRKTGNALTGKIETNDLIDPWMTGEADSDFAYTLRPLAGAEYTITAAEDIYTQDRQLDANGSRTLWYAKGDVVAVVTTGDGSADTAVFAPSRTKATYDFLSVIHDGTLGEVSITLPLGSYHVEETKPPYGYVGTTDSYDVTFIWDSQLNDVVMAKSIVKNGDSEQHFDVVRASEAPAELAEQQTLGFYNDREHARVGVYKIDQEAGKYLAGAVFNLYTRDDIYDVDGNKLFSAGDLISTSPETVADGYTYFNCDVPIRGEWYGQSDRLDASTNSGNYFIRELRAPLGYYLNDAEMDVTFTYDGEVLQVLDNICANKPTEMWVSKRDLTNDEELSGATLIIKDAKDNIVDTWVSTDTPHRVTGLHFDEEYTLTEKRPADGYAVADDIVFRLERKTDADGHELDEADVYYLKDKKKLWFIPWEEWELLDDATVIMKDDITRVQISKVDIATGKELPGAELIIKDKDGNTVAQWVSEDKPHYIEKLPAGDYKLTEITAPNGYQIAESITFTVLPTGELQTVVMKDARIPEETPHEDTPSNTPQPTPGSTPAPSPAPASTPTATPTPMPVIPQTGDVFPFALLSAAVFGSIVGFGILAYKRRKSKMDESEH